MSGRILTMAVTGMFVLAIMSGPAVAEASVVSVGTREVVRTQTTAPPPVDRPEAQEAVGRGGLRYWLIAALLALLAVLVAALGVVYWKVTVPPGKRQRP